MVMPYQMCNTAQQGLIPTIWSMLRNNHTLCNGSKVIIMVHQGWTRTTLLLCSMVTPHQMCHTAKSRLHPLNSRMRTVSVCNMSNLVKRKPHPLKLSEQHVSLDYAMSRSSEGGPNHLDLGTNVK
ncbi:uncharacterized protein LOC126100402 [Schistocerca cancellata]|uniref:uncharacterized protein LOC126100402 n=1 Tax=Schistocerca cancellata TaxID=274614 RepID=UPI0021187BE9|nr:uncharacterized protein LOC126100402 [Schistocerca cancellata]